MVAGSDDINESNARQLDPVPAEAALDISLKTGLNPQSPLYEAMQEKLG